MLSEFEVTGLVSALGRFAMMLKLAEAGLEQVTGERDEALAELESLRAETAKPASGPKRARKAGART